MGAFDWGDGRVLRGWPPAVAYRLNDANVREREREAIRKLASRLALAIPSP